MRRRSPRVGEEGSTARHVEFGRLLQQHGRRCTLWYRRRGECQGAWSDKGTPVGAPRNRLQSSGQARCTPTGTGHLSRIETGERLTLPRRYSRATLACWRRTWPAIQSMPYTPGLLLSTQMLKSVHLPHPHPVHATAVFCPPTSVALLLTRDGTAAAPITLPVSATHSPCRRRPLALTCRPHWAFQPAGALTLHPEALAG
ncbi:hypothetical protein BDU57DRAFT_510703 [Ampelomyces quisqualis]|uniref:Uncharacterized protein n=1 Tax=Ampelomyces quisqualis TaxID=50730 RepID=A0A6A5R232_AMPQU|nr:hypothetical protein BDU57DRAFT_510703 [Ampelomyces quisqualis]